MIVLCTLIIIVIDIANGQGTLITTPGCTIPKFTMIFHDDGPLNATCGSRHVKIRKVSELRIQLVMKKRFESCCYSYVRRSEIENLEDRKVTFSKCKPFKNKAIVPLVYDFINVKCYTGHNKKYNNKNKVYDDYYALAKRVKITPNKHKRSYNVLLLGMDTMSRSRMHNSMRETVQVFKQNHWLDFQGYNKIALGTLQNLMAVLSGSSENLHATPMCAMDMFACNDMFIWHDYQQRGFVTAYGEDMAFRNGTFHRNSNGFSNPPTDHYMRPLFLAAENAGRVVCSGRIFSGLQILNYILDYTRAYKRDKFFGFFWINSFSHDSRHNPKELDKALAYFLSRLKDTGVLANTFVILFSDHGIKNGPLRHAAGSYHDERLPMLFMHVPRAFRKSSSFQYSNLELNQYRLTSPFDLYLTLWDILKMTSGDAIVPKSSGCPRCKSLFQSIPEDRICSDAGIGVEWCTCHDMTDITIKEIGAMYSVLQASKHLTNLASSIPTNPCTKCSELSFKGLMRSQYFSSNNGTTYYVVAIVMSPGDLTYEVTVAKNLNYISSTYTYDVIAAQLISQYMNTGSCVDREHEHFCLCEIDKTCSL